jgi:proliferating cell nuclear antigen
MEVVIEDAKFFKSCVDAIVNIVDEGMFRISAAGIHLRTMDPSQIAMVDFAMPKEAFSKLEVDGEATIGVSLVDLSAGLPKEPKIPFDSQAILSGGAFKEMLKDAALLSSHVVLDAKDGEFIVEAHGDSGDVKIESKQGGALKEVKSTAPSRAMFPSEYLDDMTRACPEEAELQIYLKTDAPVRVSYQIGKASLSYYLAPRVETV